MAAKPKRCIGTVACLVCGNEIPARENEAGTLDMGCGYCDFVGYAKAGSEAHQVIMQSIKLNAPAESPAADTGTNNDAADTATQLAAPAAPAKPERKKLPWLI